MRLFKPYDPILIHDHPSFREGGRYYNYNAKGYYNHLFGSTCVHCGYPFAAHTHGGTTCNNIDMETCVIALNILNYYKMKDCKNPYCRLDLLEFNCGRKHSCTQCDCFIENPELADKISSVSFPTKSAEEKDDELRNELLKYEYWSYRDYTYRDSYKSVMIEKVDEYLKSRRRIFH